MAIPRSLQEILDHADELSARFADTETDFSDAAHLRAIRVAVAERAATERRLAEAVTEARTFGASWAAIAGMLGTSGEAARKRYGHQRTDSA